MTKQKACKICNTIHESEKCPNCESRENTESFKGRIIILNPEKSEIATQLKLKNKGKGITILLSSVTDPFQATEAKYKLSEKCLTVLADYGFEGMVSILTKSPTVLKVVPILKHLKKKSGNS